MAILPSNPENYDLKTIETIIKNVGQLALTIAGALAVIYLIIGAYGYFTAFGNEEKATKAKTTITWAIIGVVVIVLAKVIIMEIFAIVTNTKPTFSF